VNSIHSNDVKNDAPPKAGNIDHGVETAEIADPNAEENDTEEDADEDEEECTPEDHAPLCDDCIVARACARLNDEGQTSDVVGWPQILHALSAQQEAIDKFKDAVGLEGEFIKCSDLCRSLVSIAEQNNKTLPNASDWGCYEVGASTFCDVDLDPGRLGAFMGSSKTTVAYDDKHTPHSEINGENTSLLSYRKITTESVHPPQQTSVLQQNSPKDEEHKDAYGDTLKKGIPYSTVSFVLRMLNEFRIYGSTGKLHISSGQSSLIEADTERNQATTRISWYTPRRRRTSSYTPRRRRTSSYTPRRRRSSGSYTPRRRRSSSFSSFHRRRR